MQVTQLAVAPLGTASRRRTRIVQLVSAVLLIVPIVGLAVYLARHGHVLVQIRQAARNADPTWTVIAAGCALMAFPAAVVTIRVAANAQLPWLRTTQVELAGTFLNRIVPNGVGRAVLTGRYLITCGLPSDVAAAAIAATVAGGFLVHTGGILLTVSLGGASGLAYQPAVASAIGLGVAVAIAGFAAAWLARRQGWYAVRRGWLSRMRDQFVLLCLNPGRVFGVLGGVAAASCCTVLAFWAALNAIIPVAFLPAATVYLIGTAVSNVAPVSGGIGVTEAALTAALTMTGVPVGSALAGVLLFRLVSFWIPTLLGAGSWLIIWRATGLLRVGAPRPSAPPSSGGGA